MFWCPAVNVLGLLRLCLSFSLVLAEMMKVKKIASKVKVARMDAANKAMCYAHRHPPQGQKPTPLAKLRNVVWKTDGSHPTIQAVQQAAATYNDEKEQRGRNKRSRDTTKTEDKRIMQVFHQVRPPGCGVDARAVHDHLSKTLQKKISFRTVIRLPSSHIG